MLPLIWSLLRTRPTPITVTLIYRYGLSLIQYRLRRLPPPPPRTSRTAGTRAGTVPTPAASPSVRATTLKKTPREKNYSSPDSRTMHKIPYAAMAGTVNLAATNNTKMASRRGANLLQLTAPFSFHAQAIAHYPKTRNRQRLVKNKYFETATILVAQNSPTYSTSVN